MMNDLKIALRTVMKNRMFSLINVAGLALGLAVFMMILLWVKYELSYNGFHRDHERIAAVMTNLKLEGGEISTFPAVPPLLAEALTRDLPGIEYASTTSWGDQRQVTSGDLHFFEYGLYVSPEFLKIFSFPLLQGDPDKVLTEPNTILITQKLAKKYFKDKDPVGQQLVIDQATAYTVTGVLLDVPRNATLSFDFLMPVQDYIRTVMGGNTTWETNNMRSYVKLRAETDREAISRAIRKFQDRYTDKQPNSELSLFYLEDWYLRMDFKNGKYAGGGRIADVRLFSLIALVILLLACINFMNLSTAKSTRRAREVGVRKTIGAGRWSLVRQFYGESLLFSVLAGLVALILVSLALPAFNALLRKQITIDFTDPVNFFVFAGIIGLTGLVAGSYPAFALSSFSPIQVMKNHISPSGFGFSHLRKGLVLVQFMVSMVLLVGAFSVMKQLRFLREKPLGYDKDHLVWFPNHIPVEKHQAALTLFSGIPGVSHAALASMTFTQSNNRGSEVNWPGKLPGQDVFFSFVAGSQEIVETMGLTLLEGRAFMSGQHADTGAFILNEEAVRRMGLENPVGQIIETHGGSGRIVGVVKDFHFESLHSPIAPVIIMCRPEWTWLYYVRTTGKDMQRVLRDLEAAYQQLATGFVFDYNFQDKEYERLYRSETQMDSLVRWFSFLALFISGLGLLGLTLFTIERKTKEIGIRKVLGATWRDILAMVTNEFMVLTGLAAVIAVPVSYLMVLLWLRRYAFRAEPEWWMYLAPVAITALITLVTVGSQALRASSANPVKSLRTE